MQILDGMDAYMKLKQTGHLLPTIIVTAFAYEESDKLDILKSMPDSEILTKAFDPNKLIVPVEKMLRRKRS